MKRDQESEQLAIFDPRDRFMGNAFVLSSVIVVVISLAAVAAKKIVKVK